MFRFALLLSVFSLAVLRGPAVAAAQPAADDQARTHFESGRLYFDRGDYDASLREFEAAYDLSHRSGLLYNIYLSLERLGRLDEAAERLAAFLESDAETPAEQRANLETRLANIRERAAAARESEPAAPLAPPPPAADGGLGTTGVIGLVSLAAGGASLVVAGITGVLAVGEDDDVSARCGEDAGRVCTEDDVSSLRTLVTVSDVTFAIGAVLAVAGGTLLVIDLVGDSDDSSTEHAWLAPAFGPGQVGLQMGGAL